MRMKKFTTLALAGLVATSVFGQQPAKQKFVASPNQISAKAENVKNNMLFHDVNNQSIVHANVLPSQPSLAPNGKVAAVTPIAIGSATNAFTCLRQEQNQVFANGDLDVVGFIHRNNTAIYGGSSGQLRYDISIDGGTTFTNDVGVLNPTLTLPSRYPNGGLYNPAGNTNPNDAWIVSLTPTLGSPTWDGFFGGLAPLTTGAQTGQMEHYDFQTTGTLLPGGLCEGMPGEFWVTDAEYDGSNQTGPVTVYKGVIAAGDITWSLAGTLNPAHDLSIDGTVTILGPNISFSPDGSTGWVAFCGDLVGGQDSVLSPVFSKTTDNGATWSTPVEMDLNSVAWVADTLQSLWIDSTGAPVSNGQATCAFDYDLTVDANGNPHMAVVIGTAASGTPYSISSGIAKFMADVYSPDGGATWDIAYISPVLTFRTAAFGNTASTVSMDNNTQIARSADGNHIFYAWSDSDTALVTGNQNGIGFGQSANSAPNLRVAAMNVTTGEQTYPQLITDGDLVWEGRALFPTMAPVVIAGAANCWKLPIVMADMPGSEPADPTYFHYFGNDVSVCAAGFCEPATMTLAWDQFAFTGATAPCLVGIKDNVRSNVVLGNAYPNPTANSAVITFELPAASSLVIDVMNVYGQQVAVIANGDFNAGAHKVVLNTEKLASGVYFYNLRTNDQVLSKKLVIAK
jgi:Secretion system C-terminal sorting domain